MKRWYKLDNVGKFFASVADGGVQNVFRYSATLIDEIDENILQLALDKTILLFPSFNVNLKKGVFWYYLDEAHRKCKVTKENLPICFKLYNSSNSLLYRVSYYKKRINFEVSHILSDGLGSIFFFKTLLANYIKIKYDLDYIVTTKASYNEKAEDSFDKYYKKVKVKDKASVKNIYNYKGKKIKNGVNYLEVHLPLDKVIALSHSYDATLTSFLVSVLIFSFKSVLSQKDLSKTIKIDIPADLRRYFNSSTVKNYFGLTNVVYKFKSYDDTLEDIILNTNKLLKENLTKENLSVRVNKMIAFEKNIFCRITPLFIKNIVLKVADVFSSNMNTTCFSNVGKISLDEELMPYIENINVLNNTNKFQFTACSFKNDLSVGISSKYKYNDVIKNFCLYFSKKDIDVTINVSEVK